MIARAPGRLPPARPKERGWPPRLRRAMTAEPAPDPKPRRPAENGDSASSMFAPPLVAPSGCTTVVFRSCTRLGQRTTIRQFFRRQDRIDTSGLASPQCYCGALGLIWTYFTLILCNLLRARHTFRAKIATKSSFWASWRRLTARRPGFLPWTDPQIQNHLIAENQNQDRVS